jgi:hypothetical protein
MNTALWEPLVFHEVDSDAIEQEVLCKVSCSFAVQVFGEAHIQRRVHIHQKTRYEKPPETSRAENEEIATTGSRRREETFCP